MISEKFEQFISRFLLQQGKAILDDPHKCRSLLKDFAKGEYPNEIRLFMQTVEKKFHTIIENTDALDLTANRLIRQLQDENFLSADASSSIIELLCLILKNHAIQKPMFSQPVNSKTGNSGTKKEKRPITREMTEQSYIFSKDVYSGNLSLDRAADILENTYGMNSASAKMYINNFKCLIEGKHYTRIMKLEDTKYYIGMIYQDYGKKGLRNALNALSQHIHYLKTKGIGSPGALEKIYEKWRLRTI